MKQQLTISFIISLFLCYTISLQAQEQTVETKNDSLKLRYGLRLGTDASKLIRTALDDDYSGFEISGDYRLSKNLFIAG